MRDYTCATCEFYSADASANEGRIGVPKVGECRAKPPTLFLLMATNSLGASIPAMQMAQPQVPGDYWCGEHVPLDAPVESQELN